ncbi:MAG: TIGR04282 family arsenosugar biosynthesis glycosyltransferase [Pseudomonadota bacterium]
MSLARHLVIFARAPRLGTVKRRLARDIGQVAALRFHRTNTAGLLRRLGRDPRWGCRLAVTPDRAAGAPGGLWPEAGRVIAQGTGDLGARMARVMAALPPGPVVIVGSDIPGIQARHVAQAFQRLGDNDWVLGPASDGGYWLIGTRRRPVLRTPFDGVRWGGAHARADTLANLGGARVALLEELDDVDTVADLARRA